ncbi:cysteine dioxygenase type 1 [Daktulosphaira vitifoliae]|uniref:cysteine dioxygenase type 1 n=1 Tax=Daktulosphaira vitifoliae TaxID=58002 RepID=UPI0021A98670|nr:cysteine dioxygenase type 1 [Daktulosphaira vitifoliae]XP_050524322.1 cysteine dioxygenase type 1 [Daktulosphaira vitifoliae]
MDQCNRRKGELSATEDEQKKSLYDDGRLTATTTTDKTVEAIRGYCRHKSMPSDLYRPVSGTRKFRLTDLIAELHRVFEEDRVNVEYVQYLMESYKSDPAEWLKYAKFNKFRYTRNLVDAGNGKFNLMVLCWGEGNGSSIHDHPNSNCFMKMLAGQLSEIRFSWPEDSSDENDIKPMKEIGRSCLETNSVCHINDSMGLHRVENSSHTDKAVSLHLYCPPYEICSTFNQHTGHRDVAISTFWSIYGKKVSKKLEDYVPDDN